MKQNYFLNGRVTRIIGLFTAFITEYTLGNLCYNTPIANDVVSWLSPFDLQKLLEKIYRLPKAKSR